LSGNRSPLNGLLVEKYLFLVGQTNSIWVWSLGFYVLITFTYDKPITGIRKNQRNKIPFPGISCGVNFHQELEQINLCWITPISFSKALKQFEKTENDI